MTDVNAARFPRHLPYLLDLAQRRMQSDLTAIVDSSPFPELRGSHFRLLSLIPDDGARPSVLADIARITRPALAEAVRHLEENGYVEVQADPADGRAVIVRRTRRGDKAFRAGEAGVAQLRDLWAQDVGEDRVDALIDILRALTLDHHGVGETAAAAG